MGEEIEYVDPETNDAPAGDAHNEQEASGEGEASASTDRVEGDERIEALTRERDQAQANYSAAIEALKRSLASGIGADAALIVGNTVAEIEAAAARLKEFADRTRGTIRVPAGTTSRDGSASTAALTPRDMIARGINQATNS